MIFISYSRDSQAAVIALAEDIEALGYTVWLDRNLAGGQLWWNQILEQIRSCDAFVFALTRSSLDSPACSSEYGYAVALGKPVVPIQVSDDIGPLPPTLAQIHFVDYRRRDRPGSLALARGLAALPKPAALPDPLPTPPDVPISRMNELVEIVRGRQSLGLDVQRSILFDLERGLRSSKTRADARTLLTQLRSRADVYSDIAQAIDAIPPETKWSWPKRISFTISVIVSAFVFAFVLTRDDPAEPPSDNPAPPVVDPWEGVPGFLKTSLGDPDSRASFDFDGDGMNEDCRIVSGPTSYFVCASSRRVSYGVIDEPGLDNWPREWVDWDGDGRQDWCRIVGAAKGDKFLRCSFGNGKTLDPTVTSSSFDVGYGISGPHRRPVFERRSGVMNYCRITGSYDFEQNRPCLPAQGKGFGADVPGTP